MPLLRAEWWEAHQPLVVFMWIILLVVPFAIVYGAGDTFETVLECIVNDYLTFIVLLFGLFCFTAVLEQREPIWVAVLRQSEIRRF